MVLKLCIVGPFDSFNYFQWYVAFERYSVKLGISLTSINSSATHMYVYSDFRNDPYWQPLREADIIFVYATRRSSRHDPSGLSWWTLPKFVKAFMKPEAKMVAQYDDEFLWLFYPNQEVWWNIGNGTNPENSGPEDFFKRTGILEIPDAHISTLRNPLFAKYTTKPVFRLPLPHLFRYAIRKYSKNHEGKNIAMMVHSPLGTSIDDALENVIRPMNCPVTIFFGSPKLDHMRIMQRSGKLPVNSETFPRVDYDSYEDLLWKNCSIGLDACAGYHGWSRFVMECAIAYIPCVGSSEAVQDLFPELYTEPKDYAKQIELINRLKTDKTFYSEIQDLGRKRAIELLDEEKLCRAMLGIFNKIGASKSTVDYDNIKKPSPYIADAHQARPHPPKSL